MNAGDKYVKIVEWSDDSCFIGSCPELFYGGCPGSDARAVFDELCILVEETVGIYRQDGKQLPAPLSGKEIVNAMQGIA